ncbi:hypothetical protein AAFF_G00346920 [Aldrovandia affinis]|uniref:Uncharacterized protein n=1 Tax=Aldrovandia affinis TaxID=143900 RepID=A0AAD7SJQ6_9TELE|nr:hypothetical protein AAFF_G00346920 [Aldrovandia affinis]
MRTDDKVDRLGFLHSSGDRTSMGISPQYRHSMRGSVVPDGVSIRALPSRPREDRDSTIALTSLLWKHVATINSIAPKEADSLLPSHGRKSGLYASANNTTAETRKRFNKLIMPAHAP